MFNGMTEAERQAIQLLTRLAREKREMRQRCLSRGILIAWVCAGVAGLILLWVKSGMLATPGYLGIAGAAVVGSWVGCQKQASWGATAIVYPFMVYFGLASDKPLSWYLVTTATVLLIALMSGLPSVATPPAWLARLSHR